VTPYYCLPAHLSHHQFIPHRRTLAPTYDISGIEIQPHERDNILHPSKKRQTFLTDMPKLRGDQKSKRKADKRRSTRKADKKRLADRRLRTKTTRWILKHITNTLAAWEYKAAALAPISASNASARLLSLPAELRNNIWELVVVRESPFRIDTMRPGRAAMQPPITRTWYNWPL
jgi:hypothetical protein